ncbi:MAG: hypothetical protein HC883_04720 [Bdellovibrionaceae bacterium]|nr:hypothetical protein [Pseudobdellovibrionaceae bacterium]
MRRSIIQINRLLEYTLAASNLIAILCVWAFPQEWTLSWISLWSLIRFFLGGLSTVFGFRLIYMLSSIDKEKDKQAIGARSVVGQLAVGQGSVVIGALVSLVLALMAPRWAMSVALLIDLATSVALIVWLRGLSEKESSVLPTESLLDRLTRALTGIFRTVDRNYSVAFLASLLALSGLPTMFMHFSAQRGQGAISSSLYSAMNLINGLFLVWAAYQINTSSHPFFKAPSLFKSGMIGVLIACLLALTLPLHGWLLFFVTALLSFGSTASLLSAHGITMSRAEGGYAMCLRSSMALYLNIIFGVAELICAKLADVGLFNLWLVIKLVSGSLGLILIAEWHRSANMKVVVGVVAALCSLLLLPKVNMFSFQEDPITLAVPTLKFEFDPHRMEDIQSMFLNQQLHRSLFRFSSDGTVRIDLVQNAEFSDDRRTLRLKSKQGNGSPMAARSHRRRWWLVSSVHSGSGPASSRT